MVVVHEAKILHLFSTVRPAQFIFMYLGFAVMLFYLLKGWSQVFLKLRFFRPNIEIISNLLSIAWPATGRSARTHAGWSETTDSDRQYLLTHNPERHVCVGCLFLLATFILTMETIIFFSSMRMSSRAARACLVARSWPKRLSRAKTLLLVKNQRMSRVARRRCVLDLRQHGNGER